jgi:glucose-1-phosphate thymidylyltransferase
LSVIEKPTEFISNLAVTGIYFFDGKVSEISKGVQLSERGEFEITSIINEYLIRDELSVTNLSRGTAWLDTGNPKALQDASTYIRVIEERTGLIIGCLEEIALEKKWITREHLSGIISKYGNGSYGNYLRGLVNQPGALYE